MEPLRKELRTLRARRGMQKLRTDADTGLSALTLQTALLISVILGYDFAAGAAWLFLENRRGTPLAPGVDRSQAKAMLEDAFLKADVDKLASWTDPDSATLSSCVKKTAAKFARGYKLAAWAGHQNMKGAVVPTRSLVQKEVQHKCYC